MHLKLYKNASTLFVRGVQILAILLVGVTAVFSTVFTLRAAPSNAIEYYVSATDADKQEGDSGTTLFTFVVSQTAMYNVTRTVDFEIAGLSGVVGQESATVDDFGGTFVTGTLSMPPNTISHTVVITVTGDELTEADESFQITLSNLSGGDLVGDVAAGVIRNDDFFIYLPFIIRN